MKDLFEQIVINSFQFLHDKYGFSTPVTEDFGREISIRYTRDHQTVSIAWEIGNSPMIEIIHPSMETGATPVPWVSKDGVQRSRRFPKLRPSARFADDETSVVTYIKEIAAKFEETEETWLKEH